MRAAALFAALLALAGVASAQAQIPPEEQARRLLEDGRAAARDGRSRQALDNFNTIVTGFPGTASVDDALLEIGRYYLDVEHDLVKARESFEQVAKRFPQSDGAPGAYWQLGWLVLQTASTPADLDDALAQFTRVQRLYPRSEWVPRALHASAVAYRRAGRLEAAVVAGRRVVLEHPGSDAAPAAQFEVGYALALLGRHVEAMEELQQVRNRWPGTPLAAQALDRVTALWRLHGTDKPTFAPDPGFSVGAGDVLKGVRAILCDSAGTLWIASDKASVAVPYGPDGKMGPSWPAADPRTLTLGTNGELVLATRLAVRRGPKLTDVRSFTVPGEKPGVPEPLEKITAALSLRAGMLVADEKQKKVFRFDEKGAYVAAYPDAGEREVSRLAADPEGSVLLLDKERRSVVVTDRAGKVVRTVGPTGGGYSFRKPSDIATDAFRNLYVADEDAGVWILAPDGRLLAQLSGEEIRKPRALTVDPSGAVLVYDDRTQRVVRFR